MAAIRVAQVMGKMVGGGVESVVMNYYRHIDRNEVQFDFIVDSDSTDVPKAEIENLGGRIIIVPPYQRLNKYISTLINVFKTERYKIVHSHINTLSIFPLFAAKVAGVPVRIAHNHSTASKGETKKNMLKYLLRPFSKLMPNYYFACSEYAGKWLFGKKVFEEDNYVLMRNAVNINQFIYNRNVRLKKRQELGLKSKFVIGHVGRFAYQKNHSFLIDIFNEVHKRDEDAVLLLVGTGELEDDIKKKVEDLKLLDYVMFLGQRDDVSELMQAMDVFVLPSFYEGLPVVGVEAQAADLPCVFSDAVTKEAKILGSTKFLSLSDGQKKWANKILKYKNFKRHNKKKSMSKSGFEIGLAAEKLEDIYERICG